MSLKSFNSEFFIYNQNTNIEKVKLLAEFQTMQDHHFNYIQLDYESMSRTVCFTVI